VCEREREKRKRGVCFSWLIAGCFFSAGAVQCVWLSASAFFVASSCFVAVLRLQMIELFD